MILSRFFNSIAFRISVSIAMVVAAATIIVGYLILRDEKRTLEQELRSKGSYVAHLMAHHLIEPLLYEERHTVYSLLRASVIDEKSIVVFAEVYDEKKELIIDVYKDEKWKDKKLQPDIPQAPGSDIKVQVDDHLQVYQLSLPIHVESLGTIGYLEMGITKEYLYLTLEDIKHKIYLLCAVVIFIGIMLGFWMARKILRPILVLNKGVQMIGEGDVGVEIPVVGEGEIKELAMSFNNMSGKLKELIDEIKAAQDNLVRTEKLYAIGEFSAGVAHEIKNPLTSIKMLMHTVAHKNEALSAKDFAVIEGEINRIDRIIKEFVALARPRKIEKTDLNVRDVLEDVLLITGPKMKQSRIQFEQLSASDLPVIKGNYDALKQVFLNLVLNAIQAMNNDGKLTIETFASNGTVSIVIKDTGMGITEENLKKIFDPFFTTKAEGTGMGLALTYNIVNDHSGKIDIESKPWYGTIVKVELPV